MHYHVTEEQGTGVDENTLPSCFVKSFSAPLPENGLSEKTLTTLQSYRELRNGASLPVRR